MLILDPMTLKVYSCLSVRFQYRLQVLEMSVDSDHLSVGHGHDNPNGGSNNER